MITAERLQLLTTYNSGALQKSVGQRAEGLEFTSSKFLGITNGGQFCYRVVFHVRGGTDSAKVFLTYDPATDQVIGDTDLTNW
jgi:hypothetical protein